VIILKYGSLWGDYCSCRGSGSYGVSLWKSIRNGWDRFLQFVRYKVGNGSTIKFWSDTWCGETSLKVRFSELYRIARLKEALVRELLSYTASGQHWDVGFYLEVYDWELESINMFMDLSYSVPIRQEEAEAMCWSPPSRKTFAVNSFYKVLHSGSAQPFPWRTIWKSFASSKVSIFQKVHIHAHMYNIESQLKNTK
jgi:hypothetical protein